MKEVDRVRTLVADRIRQKNLTETGLSTDIGRNRAYISQYLKRGTPEVLPEDVRELLAPYLGVTPNELRGAPRSGRTELNNSPTASKAPKAPPRAPPFADPQPTDMVRTVDVPAVGSLPRDIPVYGVAVGGSDGDFQFNGTAIDYVRRPPGIAHATGVFAVYVTGDSMSPRYEEGDLVFVHPGRQPKIGDDVIVEMFGSDVEPAGNCYIKKLVRRTPTVVICQQYNPSSELQYEASDIKRIYKILTTADLLGV